MRVVFLGTPEFAVPSLEALLGEGFDVVAAVTQPDRPHGRSRSTAVPPPVKVAAAAEGVPVIQPARPSEPAFVARMRELAPDVGVVVAYGHILHPELLAIPKYGMLNVHPSLLPELRGAAPIEWAIINGLEKTGVTIMQMDKGLDSGPILHQIPHHIDRDVTAGELSEHLSEMGALALVETLSLLAQDGGAGRGEGGEGGEGGGGGGGGLKARPQDHARATYAPKLTRETARIRWTDPADQIARAIRGLDPKPGAWTELDGREVKLFGARVMEGGGDGAPGEIRTTDDGLRITTGRGAVEVEEVQPAGKPRMPAADWVRGRGVKTGGRFT
ncbi:MAG TPA: methionyl-tRNA formyltransferase [Gemmatimonadales bacterium]|nr:methionyl-tRNA formyltransferase [Gemmatimonadales bacterium]